MAIHRLRRLRAGFASIELLLVVAISGILAAIAIPNLLQSQRRAKNATGAGDTRNVVAQANIYDNLAPPGAAAYKVLYDGGAPANTVYMARATDHWNRGVDYQFRSDGITGEVQAWSPGSAGGGAAFQAVGTVGYSNLSGE